LFISLLNVLLYSLKLFGYKIPSVAANSVLVNLTLISSFCFTKQQVVLNMYGVAKKDCLFLQLCYWENVLVYICASFFSRDNSCAETNWHFQVRKKKDPEDMENMENVEFGPSGILSCKPDSIVAWHTQHAHQDFYPFLVLEVCPFLLSWLHSWYYNPFTYIWCMMGKSLFAIKCTWDESTMYSSACLERPLLLLHEFCLRPVS
jgi:hypothetical protein